MIASLKLRLIITDAEFDAAKLARELVANDIMSSMKGMSRMLFAIDAMVTKQIPLLTTRAREGGSGACANGKPKQKRLIERHLMLRKTFIWLLEHVHERVGLVFEHSAGGQIQRSMRTCEFGGSQMS